MAIVKHIKSRNANYSAAINYLLFEHDEKTGKKIVDESGRSILRKEFYMDGLNCDPMSFDKECELTNAHFHKNKKREDIKSPHYIISYDPADVTENGLTGERAQAISLELAKQMFPGYQALVVTHTDGHNESGNIHTHIVINMIPDSSSFGNMSASWTLIVHLGCGSDEPTPYHPLQISPMYCDIFCTPLLNRFVRSFQ